MARGPVALEPGARGRSPPSGALVGLRTLGPNLGSHLDVSRVRGVILESKPPRPVPRAVRSLPAIWGIELGLLRSADRASIDGRTGNLELSTVREVNVVTAFLENDAGRILLLRRSSRVRTFPGWWAAISGTMASSDTLAEARREILEEVGLRSTDLRSPSAGSSLLVRHRSRIFRIHPCRFRVHDPPVTLNWEHSRFAWVEPTEIARFRTVPKLAETYRAASGMGPRQRLRRKE